jgi:7-cyano-7-deazaguanine reductase
MPAKPSRTLETFPNPAPERDYWIGHVCPEYTALCPVTGQPDFGTIVIRYVPDRLCVELKSLKLYIWSFRDEGHFFEQVTNQILDDLVRALAPRRLRVDGRFKVRGGITTHVVARYRREPAASGGPAATAGRSRQAP